MSAAVANWSPALDYVRKWFTVPCSLINQFRLLIFYQATQIDSITKYIERTFQFCFGFSICLQSFP